MDIARLGFAIDSRDARTAAADLRRLPGAARDAEQGVDRSTRGMERDLDRVGKSAGGLRRALGGIAGGLAAGIASAGLGRLGMATINAASDAQEAAAMFDEVFKGAAASTREWSEETAKVIGRSALELQGQAASFQSLLAPILGDRDLAADYSETLTGLTQDLASFYNLAESDALTKLRAGLIGEAEPLRQVGVLLSAAAVEAKVFELGLASSKKEITEQMKVQGRLALILEQTADAQGDAARTSDSYANKVRALAGAQTDLRVELGNQLLPIATQLVGVMTNLTRWFAEMPEGVQQATIAVGGLVAIGGPLIASLGLMGIGLGNVGRMLGPLTRLLPSLRGGLIGLAGALIYAGSESKYLADNFPNVSRVLKQGVAGLKEGLVGIGESLDNLLGGDFLGAWRSLGQGMINMVGTWLPGVQSAVEDFKAGFAKSWSGIGDGITEAFSLARANLSLVISSLGFVAQNGMAQVMAGMKLAAVAGANEIIEALNVTGLNLPMLDVEQARADMEAARLNLQDTMKMLQQDVSTLFGGEGAQSAGGGTALRVTINSEGVDLGVGEIRTALATIPPAAEQSTQLTLATVDGLAVGVQSQAEPMRAAGNGIGLAMGDGMIAGISAKEAEIVATAERMARAAQQAVRTELQIQSPSKVMHGLGVHVAEGFAGGILTGQELVEAASGMMSGGVANGLGDVAGQGYELGGIFGQAEGMFANLVTSVLSGSQSMGDALRSMLSQIGGNLIQSGVSSLFGSLFGGASGLASGIWSGADFAGGGFTGNGSRSGGIDGQGGYLAMVHPQEYVTDLTKPQQMPMRPASYGSMTGRSAANNSTHITVGLAADAGANIMPVIQKVSRDEAATVSQKHLRGYDAELPRRNAQISRHPRRVG